MNKLSNTSNLHIDAGKKFNQMSQTALLLLENLLHTWEAEYIVEI